MVQLKAYIFTALLLLINYKYQANPNPWKPSVIAVIIHLCICSIEVYEGRHNWLKLKQKKKKSLQKHVNFPVNSFQMSLIETDTTDTILNWCKIH